MYKYKLTAVFTTYELIDFYTTSTIFKVGEILGHRWQVEQVWTWDRQQGVWR